MRCIARRAAARSLLYRSSPRARAQQQRTAANPQPHSSSASRAGALGRGARHPVSPHGHLHHVKPQPGPPGCLERRVEATYIRGRPQHSGAARAVLVTAIRSREGHVAAAELRPRVRTGLTAVPPTAALPDTAALPPTERMEGTANPAHEGSGGGGSAAARTARSGRRCRPRVGSRRRSRTGSAAWTLPAARQARSVGPPGASTLSSSTTEAGSGSALTACGSRTSSLEAAKPAGPRHHWQPAGRRHQRRRG